MVKTEYKKVKMWIQIRSMDGKKSLRVDGLSKLTKIEDLREKLVDEFEADPEEQRLFYRGKQVYHLSENNLMRKNTSEILFDPIKIWILWTELLQI